MLDLRPNLDVTTAGHLSLHGIDLVDLAKEYGTPLFVFDEDRIRQNYLRFRKAFETHYRNTIVYYSIKTNSNLAICKVLQHAGAYAEVCSELDLYTAIKAGFDTKHIILDGPYKPESLLRAAVDNRVSLINLEYPSELERLNRIAGELGQEQPIGLRVNLVKKRLFRSEPSSRFGFSMEKAYSILQQATKFENLRVKGIMAHPYLGAAEPLMSFVKQVCEKLKFQFEFINFGGGFHSGANVEQIAQSITDKVKQTLLPWEPTIVLEPGSFIANDAGIALLSVVQVKEVGGHRWIVVDGGVNVLPAPDEKRIPKVANRMNSPLKEPVNIVGPIPSPGDYISTEIQLPEIQEGDTIGVFNSGAYTLGYSSQFLYPRPYAIMITREKEIKKIREKESFEDVLRMDRV